LFVNKPVFVVQCNELVYGLGGVSGMSRGAAKKSAGVAKKPAAAARERKAPVVADAAPVVPADPRRIDRLRALRDRLTDLIATDDCCVCEKPRPSQVAALAGRLVVVLEQIDELEVASKERTSRVDDLAAARAARRSSATS
jgi:hypothetical protein